MPILVASALVLAELPRAIARRTDDVRAPRTTGEVLARLSFLEVDRPVLAQAVAGLPV